MEESNGLNSKNSEAGSRPADASRRDFIRTALAVTSATAVGHLLPPAAEAQTASPIFANPAGVSSRSGKLRAVIQLSSEVERSVPNVDQKVRLRYFQGWDPDNPDVKAPDLTKSVAVTPGPTLRAKLGDEVEIAFYNKVDDTKFSYTFDAAEGHGSHGCDLTNNPGLYPAADQFPNCFHGSSTANLHFHGTHVSPDGLGDNVLVQVMPNKNLNEKEWAPILAKIFNAPSIPARWADMPKEYQKKQEEYVKKTDKNLWEFDRRQIAAGGWPQYISGAFPNSFQIPDYKSGKYKMGQAPGTHWYHAHKHGSTSLHILSGLAGAFIIEGDYDVFIRNFYGLGQVYPPEFEKILVFQNIDPNQNLTRQTPNSARTGSGQQLINGMKTPIIRMRPNEVQLWRFVNATVGSGATGWVWPDVFTTKGFQFKQTAMDGVQLNPANYQSQPFLNKQVPVARTSNTVPGPGLLLSAGNRADVLVIAPADETPKGSPTPFTSNGTIVFYVDVSKDNPPDPSEGKGFPTQWLDMPDFLTDLGSPQTYPHYVTFGWDAEPQRNQTGGGRLTTTSAGLLNVPPRFTIDNKQFEELGPTIDQCMPIDGLQDWVLENHTTIPHPFHIHVNPFQVMEIDTPVLDATGKASYNIYAPAGNRVWQDVVAIPGGVSVNGQVVPGRVRIRHKFVDFTGTYVLHCHILAHEDRGMMQLVRVVGAGKYPSGCQANIPQHH